MQVPVWLNKSNIYFFGLALMIASLPLSKFMMSVSQFILVFNWLLDVKVVDKFRAFFRNRAAIAIVSIYLLHVIGLLWTENFVYAAKDLRIKLPVLALPIILSTSPPVGKRYFHHLMVIFIAANIAGSFFSMRELLTREIVEIRKISLFMSHIRFSLNICVAIFAGTYLVLKTGYGSRAGKALISLGVLWLLVFLVIMESVTGIAVLLLTLMVLTLVAVLRSRNRVLKTAGIAVLIVVPLAIVLYLNNIYNDLMPDRPFRYEGMDTHTSRGNPYLHDKSLGVENGHWTGQYLQWQELKTAWNQRSEIPFDSLDRQGHHLKYTLIRYLTSKGLRKDFNGVSALTENDIEAIEKGIANVDQLKESSFTNRIKTIFWEIEQYRHSGYLSGHSLTQRLEFLRAAFRIIGDQPLLGTGTGDIYDAFQQEYVEMETQLKPQFRWRTHNQYITIFATFGIIGLLWFLFALIYPAWKKRMFNDYFYLVFFCILMFSMLTEDTLENQAGNTFFAFFTSFLLLARRQSEPFINHKA
ncbi:MAG: O-antigen ligase family protein [Bacteroidales bacterium]